MNNCYPKAVSNTPAWKPLNKRHTFVVMVMLLAASCATNASVTSAVTTGTPTLKPHTAIYHSNTKGISAELKQTLEPLSEQRWRLKNHSSVMFVNFDYSAEFLVDGTRVRSLKYDVDNGMSKKRSAQLRFDWRKGTVYDQLHEVGPLPISNGLWDKLSMQAQLRMDLMAREAPLQEKPYPQISLHRIKQYLVSEEGEETLQTALGEFETIKLVEYREGKPDHTAIWLARDWDYLIIRLQRIEDGEVAYQIDLKSAELDGRKVSGK